MDLPAKEVGCHHTGFAKMCRTLVTKGTCNRWIHIMGTNPNTGDKVSKYDCVDNWGPMLTIENSQQQRCTAASVDKTCNEIVTVGNVLSDIYRSAQLEREGRIEHSTTQRMIEISLRQD